MFLHLGGNVIVPTKEIVAIIDIEQNIGSDTIDFLEIAKDEGFVIDISSGNPKSFIITSAKAQNSIYISPISSVTLKKRSMQFKYLS